MTDNATDYAVQALQVERDGLNALINALDVSSGHSLHGAFQAAVCLCHDMRGRGQGRIVVTGMGKSGHIGRKLASTLASTGTPSLFVHPAEASHGDLGMISRQDIVLALSNSGETRELSDILQYCARFSIPLIAITSGADSTLARAATTTLLLPAADEACSETLAPTTSTTMSLALGDALAVTLLKLSAFGASDFKTFHPGGKLGAGFRAVGDIVSQGMLPLIDADAPLPAAIAQMSESGLGIVGICDMSGRLIGVITDGDLRRNAGRDLMALRAGDVMSSSPVTVTPGQLAAEALALLNERRIQAVFVVDGGTPVGLLHIHDFLKQGVM